MSSQVRYCKEHYRAYARVLRSAFFILVKKKGSKEMLCDLKHPKEMYIQWNEIKETIVCAT